MPQPTSLSIRHTIITLRNGNCSQAEIAVKTGVSLGTVKTIIKRYREHGESGLTPSYDQCGQRGIVTDAFQVRCYLALRRWHPTWGYDKISSLVAAKYPTLKLADRRTVYRWWHQHRLVQLKSKPPKTEKKRATKPHQVWQIDAKEMMHTQADRPHCWLNIVDEFTGMVIDPPVFPPRED